MIRRGYKWLTMQRGELAGLEADLVGSISDDGIFTIAEPEAYDDLPESEQEYVLFTVMDDMRRSAWRISKEDDRFIAFSKGELLSLAKLILERFPNGE